MLQKTLDNLKDKPKDDKVAVASGIAVSVVVILFVGWAIFFFRNIQKNSQNLNFTSGTGQSGFDFTSTKDAQAQLQKQRGSGASDLEEIREQSAGGSTLMQEQTTVDVSGSADQFGTPDSGY